MLLQTQSSAHKGHKHSHIATHRVVLDPSIGNEMDLSYFRTSMVTSKGVPVIMVLISAKLSYCLQQRLVLVSSDGRKTSPRTSPYCSLYFVSFWDHLANSDYIENRIPLKLVLRRMQPRKLHSCI